MASNENEMISDLTEQEDMHEGKNSIARTDEMQPFPHAGSDPGTTNMAIDNAQQSIEVENGTIPNHERTDGGKHQMTSVVLISIMLVLVAVTFSQSLSPFIMKKYNKPSPGSQEILLVYMLVGLLIIAAMFLRKQDITESRNAEAAEYNRQVSRNNIKYILRDYLSIVGMSIFLPFACILDLSHIIAAISCDRTWRFCGDQFYRDYLVDMFYHLIRILFMGAEFAFCSKFHGTRFKEYGLVRCGIMIVMAANLGLWFLSLVYETTEQGEHLDGEEIKCSNESGYVQNQTMMPDNFKICVSENSSAHRVTHAMNLYLYPFAIEFSLLVGEFLVTKFVNQGKRKSGNQARPPQRFVGGLGDEPQSLMPESNLTSVERHRTCQTRGSIQGDDQQLSLLGSQDTDGLNLGVAAGLVPVIIIAIGLIASFLYLSLSFVDSFANDQNKTETDSQDWGQVYETYSVINYMLVNCLLVVGYVCGYGFEIHEKNLHGLDWLVLISAFGPFMRELLPTIAIATSYTDLSPADFPVILICSRLANWTQLILQTPFIFLSERWRLTQRQRTQSRYLCQEKILKAIIFCLAVTNLMNWITDSIVLAHSSTIKKEVMDKIFRVNNWQLVERISLPLMIFFRFNSFLLFTRAYLGD